MVSSVDQLFSPDGFSEHQLKVLKEEEEPHDEYELQSRLVWQYYKRAKEMRGKEVTLEQYADDPDMQEEAVTWWFEHGLGDAFRGLVGQRRKEEGIEPAVDSEKMRPQDDDEKSNSEEEATSPPPPTIDIDEVISEKDRIYSV